MIPVMTNHEKDRHVLAAAVKAPCEVIVTYNLKDFPGESIKPHGIEVKHPDEFLIDLYHIDSEMVASPARCRVEKASQYCRSAAFT